MDGAALEGDGEGEGEGFGGDDEDGELDEAPEAVGGEDAEVEE